METLGERIIEKRSMYSTVHTKQWEIRTMSNSAYGALMQSVWWRSGRH
jgi:hypothetical protein